MPKTAQREMDTHLPNGTTHFHIDSDLRLIHSSAAVIQTNEVQSDFHRSICLGLGLSCARRTPCARPGKTPGFVYSRRDVASLERALAMPACNSRKLQRPFGAAAAAAAAVAWLLSVGWFGGLWVHMVSAAKCTW